MHISCVDAHVKHMKIIPLDQTCHGSYYDTVIKFRWNFTFTLQLQLHTCQSHQWPLAIPQNDICSFTTQATLCLHYKIKSLFLTT